MRELELKVKDFRGNIFYDDKNCPIARALKRVCNTNCVCEQVRSSIIDGEFFKHSEFNEYMFINIKSTIKWYNYILNPNKVVKTIQFYDNIPIKEVHREASKGPNS
jgi:hypothetical protein